MCAEKTTSGDSFQAFGQASLRLLAGQFLLPSFLLLP